jgi:hypothetical protein
MIHQNDDLVYGWGREDKNHKTIEKFLGVTLIKLDKYNCMDWVEKVPDGDESPPWYVEQKARKMTYDFLKTNYKSPTIKYPSALIGKNKIDFMKANGNGLVVFDFTDKIMYWIYDDAEYAKMEVEQKFVRGSRYGCVDKPNPVVHIPCELLKEM